MHDKGTRPGRLFSLLDACMMQSVLYVCKLDDAWKLHGACMTWTWYVLVRRESRLRHRHSERRNGGIWQRPLFSGPLVEYSRPF
jgi:hypothetical protein